MKMTKYDYQICCVDRDNLFLAANLLAHGLEWPAVVVYESASYEFVSNEVMKEWMVGNFSGHAKYVKISTNYDSH